MLKEKHPTRYDMTRILFVAYLLFLVWNILFKMEFSLSRIEHVRAYNLIPFYYGQGHNVRFHYTEVLYNLLAFLPMGVYLSLIFQRTAFRKKAVGIFAFSLALEGSQYILAVGRFDITDLITNTLGGMIGIGIYRMGCAVIRDRENANRIIAVLVNAGVVLLFGIACLLLAAN